jgi:hypothetical protein
VCARVQSAEHPEVEWVKTSDKARTKGNTRALNKAHSRDLGNYCAAIVEEHEEDVRTCTSSRERERERCLCSTPQADTRNSSSLDSPGGVFGWATQLIGLIREEAHRDTPLGDLLCKELSKPCKSKKLPPKRKASATLGAAQEIKFEL